MRKSTMNRRRRPPTFRDQNESAAAATQNRKDQAEQSRCMESAQRRGLGRGFFYCPRMTKMAVPVCPSARAEQTAQAPYGVLIGFRNDPRKIQTLVPVWKQLWKWR
jgi:hypothetical protein